MKILNKATHTNVPCPFCSLLCDDLVIINNQGSISARKNACDKAVKEFNRPVIARTPKISGKDSSLEQAISHAAAILKKSQQPLFSGLSTDVNGMRSVMSIAEHTGGIVDHIYGDSATNNLRVLQNKGWINTTLAEVKNRADLIILVGTNTSVFPRFFERIIMNTTSLFSDNLNSREIIYLGDDPAISKIKKLDKPKLKQLKCNTSQLADILSALKMLISGKDLFIRKVAGIEVTKLQQLAKKMQSVRYGVMIWSPSELPQQHADLTIDTLCGLIKDLNLTTRFAGLPLGGNEGGMTAASVCAWQSGYPLRVNFANAHPEYDLRYSSNRLLANHEVDALVWIATLSSDIQPPKTPIPTIALTTPGINFKQHPQVYIPVATPGIDHQGHMIRCDSVVSQRLKQLRHSGLPSLTTILNSIQQMI